MAELETRLDRIDQNIQTLAGVTGAMAREVQSLVQGLATDRAAFHNTLRDLSGFVATASLALERVERQIQRLAEATEVGFAHLRTLLAETNRQIAENNQLITGNNRLILETNRRIDENNRRIDENTAVLRRLLEILARGRGDGQGMPE